MNRCCWLGIRMNVGDCVGPCLSTNSRWTLDVRKERKTKTQNIQIAHNLWHQCPPRTHMKTNRTTRRLQSAERWRTRMRVICCVCWFESKTRKLLSRRWYWSFAISFRKFPRCNFTNTLHVRIEYSYRWLSMRAGMLMSTIFISWM